MVSDDINSDVKPDIIVLERISEKIEIFLNNGNKIFTVQIISYSDESYPTSITTCDINNDGKIDIIMTDDILTVRLLFFSMMVMVVLLNIRDILPFLMREI
jgi:hypothetical protein